MFNVVMQVTPAVKTETDAVVQPQATAVQEDLGLEMKREPANELAPQLSLLASPAEAALVEKPVTEAMRTEPVAEAKTEVANIAEVVKDAVTEKAAEGVETVKTAVPEAKAEPAAEPILPKEPVAAVKAEFQKLAEAIVEASPVELKVPEKSPLLNVAQETIKIEMKLDVAPDLGTPKTEEEKQAEAPRARLVEAQRKQQEEFREIAKGHAYASMCWSAFTGVQRKLATGSSLAAQQGDPMMMVRSLMTAHSEATWAIKSVQNAYGGEEMPSFVSDALASIRAMRDSIGRKLTTATGMNVLDPEVRTEIRNQGGELQGGKFVQAGGFAGGGASLSKAGAVGTGETATQGTHTNP